MAIQKKLEDYLLCRLLHNSLIGFWIIFTSLYSNSLEATNWDVEYWQYLTVKNWESGAFKLYTQGELRVNQDVSRIYYYRVAENLAYQALSWLVLEAHYSFIYNIPTGSSDFISAHRIELEVNPSLHLDDGIEFVWRNRFELIRNQGNAKWQSIFRHRLKTVFPINGFNKLISVNFLDEIFYNFNINKFTENRFVPCELTFQFSPELNLDVFLMVRNFFATGTRKWHRSLVFGSTLRF